MEQRSDRILCAFFAVTVIVSSFLGSTNGIDIGHIDNNVENIAARKRMRNEKVSSNENDKSFWDNVGNEILREKLNTERQYGVAKNVIFFIGDGMSVATLTASRIYKGQLENKPGENEKLSFEKFPYTGLSKTYCVDSQVADSACSATAYLMGVKGNIETIGVTGAVSNRDCLASNDPDNHAVSSMMWAQRVGKRTGVVTNMRVTHATPAGAYANVANRNWECDDDMIKDKLAHPDCAKSTPDIARQLIERDTGRNLNVIMGGGRQKFFPNSTVNQQNNRGQRQDGRDLIQEWLDIERFPGAKKAFVGDRSQLESLKKNETDFMLGLFNPSHMTYNLLANKSLEPTLVEMTEAAIEVLSKGDKGYYLFVEGGNIDWAHHVNLAHVALDEAVMLSNAVQRAVELTSRDDTLIVVSSDHSHTLTVNGYPHRGNDIFGHPKKLASDKLPYSTLSYANGPSAVVGDTSGKRHDISVDDTHDPTYKFPSMVNKVWETHGGDDVAVFALGPWAHLFVGNYEQNYIPYAISYAAKMGPGADHKRNHEGSSAAPKTSMAFHVVLSLFALYSIVNLLR